MCRFRGTCSICGLRRAGFRSLSQSESKVCSLSCVVSHVCRRTCALLSGALIFRCFTFFLVFVCPLMCSRLKLPFYVIDELVHTGPLARSYLCVLTRGPYMRSSRSRSSLVCALPFVC